ncbi:MAG TPA: D-alanyl-D-alanine carboxypeptidase [Erysipelothrix sp.]
MYKKITNILLILFIIILQTSSLKAETIQIVNLDEQKIKSETYLLYDRKSKQILAHKNGFEKIAPASITKVLTSITALELIEQDLSTPYVLPQAVFDGLDPIASIAWFEPEEELTLKDIIYGIQLPSGADATRAISYYLTQDPENLALAMNEKAQEIGMANSNFVNTSGLDHENHYSTAYDLALLVDYALENKDFKELYETVEYTTSINHIHPNGIGLTNLSLSYALQEDNRYIKGAKSGYTENAGRSLSSYAEYKGQELIFISLNIFDDEADGKDPIEDALYVYDTVFSRYTNNLVMPKNTIFDSAQIKNGENYSYKLNDDLFLYLPIGISKDDLKIKINNKPDDLIAPVAKGTDMGSLKVTYQDKLLYEQDFITTEEIKVNWEGVVKQFFIQLFEILVIVAIIVGLGLLLYKQVHKPKKR